MNSKFAIEFNPKNVKMIFYSDEIINQFVGEDVEMIFTYFTYPKINLEYIRTLLRQNSGFSNKVAFYCFDDVFDIRNCPSCMIYSKDPRSDENIYYIMIICTHRKFRGLGYATMLMDGFVEKIRLTGTSKIILSSLDDVVSYYQKYGFEVVDCDLSAYPGLARFEKHDKSKIDSIMELVIEN